MLTHRRNYQRLRVWAWGVLARPKEGLLKPAVPPPREQLTEHDEPRFQIHFAFIHLAFKGHFGSIDLEFPVATDGGVSDRISEDTLLNAFDNRICG